MWLFRQQSRKSTPVSIEYSSAPQLKATGWGRGGCLHWGTSPLVPRPPSLLPHPPGWQEASFHTKEGHVHPGLLGALSGLRTAGPFPGATTLPPPHHPQQNQRSGGSSGAYQRGLGALGSGDEAGPGYTFSRILMFPRHLRLPRSRVTLTALKGHAGHTASDSGPMASPHCRKHQQLTNRLVHSAITPHCSFQC